MRWLICTLIATAACTGPAGEPGMDGRDGIDGAPGPMGLPGAMGTMGEKGDPGAPGNDGVDGKDGVPGMDGATGATGPAGANGTNGTDGVNGTNGADGVNGTNGTNGTNGVDGKDGADGQTLAQALQAVLDKVVPKRAAILNVYCYQPCPSGAAPGSCSAGLMWLRGTGTKLATGEVLTAHHVAESASGCFLRAEDGSVVGQSTTLFQPLVGRDLVHIQNITWTPDGMALPGFEVKKAHTPKLGELILVASFPGSVTLALQTTFGHVTSTSVSAVFPSDLQDYWSGAWASDNASTNGSSGGPVFDSAGDLIGILVARPSDDSLDLRFNLPLIW